MSFVLTLSSDIGRTSQLILNLFFINSVISVSFKPSLNIWFLNKLRARSLSPIIKFKL